MGEKGHCGDGEVKYKPVKEGLTTIIELREGAPVVDGDSAG
jgi:hypothetical protein